VWHSIWRTLGLAEAEIFECAVFRFRFPVSRFGWVRVCSQQVVLLQLLQRPRVPRVAPHGEPPGGVGVLVSESPQLSRQCTGIRRRTPPQSTMAHLALWVSRPSACSRLIVRSRCRATIYSPVRARRVLGVADSSATAVQRLVCAAVGWAALGRLLASAARADAQDTCAHPLARHEGRTLRITACAQSPRLGRATPHAIRHAACGVRDRSVRRFAIGEANRL
jgi:hypothetical protein